MPEPLAGMNWTGMGRLPILSDNELTRRGELQRRRLRIYRVALPAGVSLMLFPLVMNHVAPYLNPFDQLAIPVLAVVYVLLAALCWTRVPVNVIDFGMIAALSGYQYGRLGFVLADHGDPAPAATLASTMPWMVAVLVINAWIMYDRPRFGVVINVTLFVVLITLTVLLWPVALPSPQWQYLAFALGELLGLSAGVVAAQVLIARQSAALMLIAQQAQAQAMTDVLTGLPNRRALLDALTNRADRPEGLLAVALIDVDHFKAVNDTHGHAFGDEVLKVVAARLAGQLPPGGMVGRYGGEEFLALLPVTREGTAMALCESLRAGVAQEDILGLRVTVSVGVSVGSVPLHPVSLLEIADAALYRAKESGRNAVKSVPATSHALGAAQYQMGRQPTA